MRKLFILTAALMLTVSAGCGCCDWCKRGAAAPCGQPPCACGSSCPCQTGPTLTPGTQMVPGPGPEAYAAPAGG